MPTRSSWAWWKALPSVAKAIAGCVLFVSAVVGLFGTLVALSVVDNPFESTTDRLTKGGRELSDAGSAKVNISRIIRSGSNHVTDTGQGTVDFRGETGQLSFSSGVRQIFMRPYLYQAAPATPGVWCEYDLSVLGPGFLWGALTGFQNDPGTAVRNLKELGDSEEVGDEVLFGFPVTHYAGHIDLNKLLERTQDPELRQLLREFSSLNGGKLPLEVWLGKVDDRVLQLASRFDVPGAPYGLSGRVNVNATLGFSQFGAKVSVRRPPASKTAQSGKRGCPAVP
jgi:hypothetical protein